MYSAMYGDFFAARVKWKGGDKRSAEDIEKELEALKKDINDKAEHDLLQKRLSYLAWTVPAYLEDLNYLDEVIATMDGLDEDTKKDSIWKMNRALLETRRNNAEKMSKQHAQEYETLKAKLTEYEFKLARRELDEELKELSDVKVIEAESADTPPENPNGEHKEG